MGKTGSWMVKLRHLLPFYRQHALSFGIGFLLLAATALTTAAIPYVMKLAIDTLTQPVGQQELGYLTLTLIGLALLNAVTRVKARTHIFGIGRRVEYELRKQYHGKLLELDTPFFNKERTGDLVARGNNDILAVRMFIGPGFLQISNTAMAYAVTLPIMIGLDPLLTLLIMAPFPIALIAARYLTRILYRLSRRVADRFGELSSFVQETIAGVAVIRAHAREESWRQRFQTESQTLYQAHLDHTRLQSLFSPLVILSGGAGSWILLYYGGKHVAAGTLTVGDFVAFSGYLAALVWPTVGLGWILTVLQRGLAALERIGRILDTAPFLPPALYQSVAEAPCPRGEGAIHIRHLSFAFEEQGSPKKVLSDITMEIPAGSFIGLVGRVGSGKSVLLNCLARLYPIPKGTITLDGRDLMEIPESQLRQTLIMAPQESFLFSATIQENIQLGARGELSEERAWHVAQQAVFDKEIETFPKQLQTLVGERGITLSGGQRQRAALARALAADPVVLLLDDIFSSVDAHTEARILDNLRDVAKGRTIVMVCHRVAALHNADHIYLLDEGEIKAQGSHQQLLENSSLYQNLHSHMAKEEALEALQAG
ncbi:MAG: ABC transporter ATP-binding protein [Magnetococcales bacterium]|nr:ABC transporter ATP-binding protein [Magnetococcales bacterium]